MSISPSTGLLAAGRSDSQLSDWARNELVTLSALLGAGAESPPESPPDAPIPEPDIGPDEPAPPMTM